MKLPLRLAVIGVGDVAYRDYLPHVDRIADLARVEMVIARDRVRVETAARDFAVPLARTDWRDALGPEVDAVLSRPVEQLQKNTDEINFLQSQVTSIRQENSKLLQEREQSHIQVKLMEEKIH